MATTNSFDRYDLRISGGNTRRTGLIMCYLENSFVGRIDFYPDGTDLPEDYLWHPNISNGYIILHMPMSRFEAVLSTIRMEKPLHLYINVNRGNGSSTKGQGYLSTTEKEPTGEEEGLP